MISTIVSKPLSAQKCSAGQISSHACRVVRQQEVFSALAPLLIKAVVRQVSERRELAHQPNGYVVFVALAPALYFLMLVEQ